MQRFLANRIHIGPNICEYTNRVCHDNGHNSNKKYCVMQVHVLKVKDKKTSNFFQITCTGTKRTFPYFYTLEETFYLFNSK
jgi:hypothetical protein